MRKLAASLTVAAFATGLMVLGGGSALANTDDGHHHWHHSHSWHQHNYQRDDHRTYDDHRTCAAEDSLNLLNCARVDIL